MKRDNKQITVLNFIHKHVAETGAFPSNADISNACDVFQWQVGNCLTRLVNAGRLHREQVAEKGTIIARKYRYSLVRTAA